MNDQLEIEQILKETRIASSIVRIIYKYLRRDHRHNHYVKFHKIHEQFINKLLFLNSIEHKGYCILVDFRRDKLIQRYGA